MAIYTASSMDSLQELDLVIRAIRNSKISHVYFRLFFSLVDTYPTILTGELITDFQASKVRENAGWASKESCTKFLNDLRTVGAILEYDPGKYEQEDNIRLGAIRGNPEMMPYPELWRLTETDQRNKERMAQKRRDDQKMLVLECVKCGSNRISYNLLPTCKNCGHRHQMIYGVPVENISINPDTPVPELELDIAEQTTEPITPILAPMALPVKHIPHCRHFQCIGGDNHTEWRLSGFYCPVHKGYINEKGLPL